jgi:hypothetical protein
MKLIMYSPSETHAATTPPAPADSAIPCPKCEYDLRGQNEPRCPECGFVSESFEELREASQRAASVLTKTHKALEHADRPITIGFVVGSLFHLVEWLFPLALETSVGVAIRYAGAWCTAIVFAYGGFLALRILITILACQVDPNIPSSQRRTLLKLVPTLMLLQLIVPLGISIALFWFLI